MEATAAGKPCGEGHRYSRRSVRRRRKDDTYTPRRSSAGTGNVRWAEKARCHSRREDEALSGGGAEAVRDSAGVRGTRYSGYCAAGH